MYPNASCATSHLDVRRHVPVVVALPVPPRRRLTWRHLATALVLLLTLPVFAAAALICLPVLALGGVVQGLRQVLALQPGSVEHPGRPASTR